MTERPMCTCKEDCPVHSVGGDVLNARELMLVDALETLLVAVTMPMSVLKVAMTKAETVLSKVQGQTARSGNAIQE